MMDRWVYNIMFGLIIGDFVRLGVMDLWIKVERDYMVYGEECKFGGGKMFCEGMG